MCPTHHIAAGLTELPDFSGAAHFNGFNWAYRGHRVLPLRSRRMWKAVPPARGLAHTPGESLPTGRHDCHLSHERRVTEIDWFPRCGCRAGTSEPRKQARCSQSTSPIRSQRAPSSSTLQGNGLDEMPRRSSLASFSRSCSLLLAVHLNSIHAVWFYSARF